jgi:D-lactate dehydrogenase
MTGRGKIINTKGLIKGLKEGKIGSTGLDVYVEETDHFENGELPNEICYDIDQ